MHSTDCIFLARCRGHRIVRIGCASFVVVHYSFYSSSAAAAALHGESIRCLGKLEGIGRYCSGPENMCRWILVVAVGG